MKFTKLAATLMCSVVLLCGCAKNSEVAIKVNDSTITKGEFYGDFNKLKKIQVSQLPKEQQGAKDFITLALKENFVNDVIVRTLLKEEFEKRKIEATEEEVKNKKDAIIQRIGSEADFKKILKQNGISNSRLKADLENEVKIDKLAEQVVTTKISEKDAKAYYNSNKEQFKVPETVHAYHVLISTDEAELKRNITDADKEAKLSNEDIDKKVKEEMASKEKVAKELQAQLAKNPKDFEKIAKEKSDDKGSAKNGGDLGLITRDSVVKEFGDMAFTQKLNTVSPVVKSQFGYHIIYVTEKNKAGMKPFDEIKADLTNYLQQQANVAEFGKFVEGLKSKAKIEYVDESLKPESIRKEAGELSKKLEEQNKK